MKLNLTVQMCCQTHGPSTIDAMIRSQAMDHPECGNFIRILLRNQVIQTAVPELRAVEGCRFQFTVDQAVAQIHRVDNRLRLLAEMLGVICQYILSREANI